MPELAHPLWLLVALTLPLLIWQRLRRPSSSVLFSDLRLVAGLPDRQARLARWGMALLPALALLLLLLALTRPRWPDLQTRLEVEGIAIAILLDVSGSMAEQDFTWDDQRLSRLEAARRTLRQFLQGGNGLPGRSNDLVALVAFATRPETACPLTLNHEALLHLLDAQQPRSLPTESQTNIGDALVWGLRCLEPAGDRHRVLVLLSDGEHNVPSPALKPRQAAQLAAKLGVPIYAIDASGENAGSVREGPDVPRSDRELARQALQALARLTGGQYFTADGSAALLHAWQQIDQLEREPIQSFRYRRYHEAYPWLGLAALGTLLVLRVAEATVWRHLP